MSLYEPLFRKVLFPAYESALRRQPCPIKSDERDSAAGDQCGTCSGQVQGCAHCWSHGPYYRIADAPVVPITGHAPRRTCAAPAVTKADIRATSNR